LDFTAVDFMNEVLGYKVDITKINHDIQGINEMSDPIDTPSRWRLLR